MRAGDPVDLSPWAYAWRADRAIQPRPEACFIPRRLAQQLVPGTRLAVFADGAPWSAFDPDRETVTLAGLCGSVQVTAEYGS